MDKKSIKKNIKELEKNIARLNSKKNKMMFLVPDTKGVPMGELFYIYDLAYNFKNRGYNVQMLYAEKDFVGVGSWLDEKYASLPHFNVTRDVVDASPCDILFIPELYGKTMGQLRELHCAKVAILFNFERMCELLPLGTSWEKMGIQDCITTTDTLKERINEVFPKVRVSVIHPSVDTERFNRDGEKQLIVNVICKDVQRVTDNLIKPFKWRNPGYGFITFNASNGVKQSDWADFLKQGVISIWMDERSDFGYSAIEAMACGNIVIGKIPENEPEWMFDENGELSNNGLWFFKDRELPDLLSQAIYSVLHESVPQVFYDDMAKTVARYSIENQNKDIDTCVEEGLIKNLKTELTMFCDAYKNKLNQEEN